MQSNKPLVSVVIVTWNRKDEVLKAINSVLNQTYKHFEIIIVDNHSTDGTYEVLTTKFAHYSNIKIIRTHKNLGCPPARNIGFANAKGEIIFSLDDDGWLDEKAIEEVVKSLMEDEKIAVVGCKILDPEKSISPGCSCNYDDKKRKVSLFTGGAFAIRKSLINEVGYFPDYFRQAEESYLALKILDKGYEILYNPDCVMFHYVSPKGRNNYQIVYEGFKNDIENIRRLLPLRYAVPIIVYKFFSHFRNYLRQGYLIKFPLDAVKVLMNIRKKFDDEKIRFETYKTFRRMR